MQIGVKFCGGCNPRFDRSGALKSIRSSFDQDGADAATEPNEKGDVSFEFAKDGGAYEVLLTICGCNNQCADTDGYTFEHKIGICDAGGVTAVIREIEKLRK